LEEERLINQVAWIPFDLSRGPLVRIRLLRTAKDEHILITSTHHIATDAWSEALLMRELIVAYGAFREDREPELPHLPIQYADFAYWQRENLSPDLLRKQMGYWREQLAALPTMNLPVECRL